MLFVCFLVMFDSFSVEPQEVPLPDTFINPAFQVAHHLWWVKFRSNLFNFLKWWPMYWLGAFVTVKWIVVIDWLCRRAVWGGVRANENWCSWGWWLLALSHDLLYAYRLLQAGLFAKQESSDLLRFVGHSRPSNVLAFRWLYQSNQSRQTYAFSHNGWGWLLVHTYNFK